MKATGIIRRIDELGRIVLPKDIRRSLNLKVGTPLEIYIDGKTLLLKEYSQMNNLKQSSTDIVDCISSNLECDCFITDTNKVICSCGKCKKDRLKGKIFFNVQEVLDSKISTVLSNIMEERKCVIHNKTSKTKLQLVSSNIQEFCSAIICPVLVNGDVLGTIVCLSNNRDFSSVDAKCIKIVNCLLIKQCEL